ncbi:hypothetical protein ACKFKG_09410 [Phormidesmis sp. 146-35]
MNYCDFHNLRHQKSVKAFSISKRLKRMMLAIAVKLKSVLSLIWNLASSSSEPQVRQRRDRFGQTYFQVYDPATRCSASLHSEQEVRQWLEQRFYCR